MIRPIPLSPQDDWAVGPDGRIALIRASDYHVEWVTPSGQTTHGSPVEYRPVRIREAEKTEWLEHEAANGLNYNWNDNGRTVEIKFTRGMGRMLGGRSASPASSNWPETMPPFRARRTIVSPDGNVWVERSVRAGSNTQIDIFDDAGKLTGSINLPAGRHVVGFGTGTVYLTYLDDDHLVWVERYRIHSGA